MLMADDRSNVWSSEEGFSFNGEDVFGDGLSIDMDTLLIMLSENPETSETRPEDSSFGHVMQGAPNFEGVVSSGFDLSGSSMFSPPNNVGPSDLKTVSLDGSEFADRSTVFSEAKLEPKMQLASPVHSYSGSLVDWMPVPSHGHFCQDKDTVTQNSSMSNLRDGKEMGHTLPNFSETFSFPADCSNNHSAANQFNSYGFDIHSLPDGDNKMVSARNVKQEHFNDGKSSKIMMSSQMEMLNDIGAEVSSSEEDMAVTGLSDTNYGGNFSSAGNMFSSFNCNDDFLMEQETFADDNDDNHLDASLLDSDLIDIGDATGLFPSEASDLSSSAYLTSNSCRKSEVLSMEEMYVLPESKRPRLSSIDDHKGTTSGMPTARPVVHDHYLDVWDINPLGVPVSSTGKRRVTCTNLTRDRIPSLPAVNGSVMANINGQMVQSDSFQICDTNDDGDVCVLEDISGPARQNFSAVNGKFPVASQSTVIYNSFNSTAVGHIKHKANGESHIFRAALQDLCQQKLEDSPPEGFMAVPLLKHQRIALSWMVRKENAVSCSGGILADDQGLGKTVSTIALILKERSPSSVESNWKESEPETLNLDDDDDDENEGTLDVGESNQGGKSCQMNDRFCGRKSASTPAKLRPAAGTLIVCPTSVLRQWSEELQNKVTSKANLSVLVYHGSNRTKDPHELAKYDVVLTTYAIVSMEVPKKPLVDEDDDDTKGASDSPLELSSFKNRKYPPCSSKKSSKSKKSEDVDLRDIRPLAGVGWFRVVLDEAQSIKNHRTQVARACWGLRAKRRWCLSGTPMQNAVDDLYSYFRFLKFDPYSAYKAFRSGIKHPIQRSPVNGYRRLQAVLKTIMLRRTKGTVLDGEPIINLPPKTIKLHKVDFSPEEREFYQTLEAESRAQFAEYAAAGTVQKNYVNILLMLLRLRQACDHPLLVRGFNSNSKSISSVEMVKKIPREKQLHLLQCYEASLAICGICRDPPEDAVVTRCGHIFCNQCICEHLSGDDTHCPGANCKTHLKGVTVFSVAALRCSLIDQPIPQSTFDCPDPKVEQISEPISSVSAYDSSKIRAALEVLQSLNKPHDYSRTCNPSSMEEGTHTVQNSSELRGMSDEENNGRDQLSRGFVGEKAIVFSQWTRMLDLLEECLKNSSIQYRRLDGTMSVIARDKAVKDFNTLPEVSVMIMSLKAASLGLNMVAACHVLMLDLWWNPTTEDQAIDRAHRIGQTRPVRVWRLTVKDTVEDRILALQQKKREMVSSAFGEDDSGTQSTRLTVEDLNYLFS